MSDHLPHNPAIAVGLLHQISRSPIQHRMAVITRTQNVIYGANDHTAWLTLFAHGYMQVLLDMLFEVEFVGMTIARLNSLRHDDSLYLIIIVSRILASISVLVADERRPAILCLAYQPVRHQPRKDLGRTAPRHQAVAKSGSRGKEPCFIALRPLLGMCLPDPTATTGRQSAGLRRAILQWAPIGGIID